jgi:hypothetical protein
VDSEGTIEKADSEENGVSPNFFFAIKFHKSNYFQNSWHGLDTWKYTITQESRPLVICLGKQLGGLGTILIFV